MPVATSTTVATKAVASGGIGVALAFILNDNEFIPLLLSGVFASVSSYFYDWVHRDPRHIGLKEFSELIKYNLYGITVMFVVFYLGKEHGSEYVSLPLTSWGFVSALCAGSAVGIVEWFAKMFDIYVTKKVSK